MNKSLILLLGFMYVVAHMAHAAMGGCAVDIQVANETNRKIKIEGGGYKKKGSGIWNWFKAGDVTKIVNPKKKSYVFSPRMLQL